MTRIIVRENPLVTSEDVEHLVPEGMGVGDYLRTIFDKWPARAVLYQDSVKKENIIPLRTETDARELNTLVGNIYVVIHPGFLGLIGVALLGFTVYLNLRKKKQPGAAKPRETDTSSANNKLTNRSNRERLGERIPDIYGTVRSVPDKIALPYKTYVDNQIKEVSWFCVGRGSYELSDIKEGDAPLIEIAGLTLTVFGPNTKLREGGINFSGASDEPLIWALPVSSIDNNELLALNQQATLDVEYMTLEDGLQKDPGGGAFAGAVFPKVLNYNDVIIENTDHYAGLKAGDTIIFNSINNVNVYSIDTWAWNGVNNYFPDDESGPVASLNFSGTYVVSKIEPLVNGYTVDALVVSLRNPERENADWAIYRQYFDDFVAQYKTNPSTTFPGRQFYNVGDASASRDKTVNWTYKTQKPFVKFIVDDSKTLSLNLYFPEGLYGINGSGTKTSAASQIRFQYQEVDINDKPIGEAVTEDQTFTAAVSAGYGLTKEIVLPSTGRYQITVTRINNATTPSGYQEWKTKTVLESVYVFKSISERDFGNVTVIRAIQYQDVVSDDTSPEPNQDRKLNMLASRLIDRYDEASGTFVPLQVTSRVCDILRAISLDPKIGNRDESEIDFDNWFAKQKEVEDHFGHIYAGEFNYTFDDEDFSFEEIVDSVCSTGFMTAYRHGKVMRLNFEKPNSISRLLFNHRNKLPESEKRTVSFGFVDGKDGVEIEWQDTKDGEKKKVYEPRDQSAINSETDAPVGITHRLQAYFHAKRIYAKLRYQNSIVEFEATHEAQLLGLNDRVQVADNTRAEVYDGQVLDQDGLILTLSQPFYFQADKEAVIFLQSIDGTVEAIPIQEIKGESHQVLLERETELPLALDPDYYANTTYEIVVEGSPERSAFLINEKTPKDGLTLEIRAVNYDDRYYAHDKDFANGVVNIEGNVL